MTDAETPVAAAATVAVAGWSAFIPGHASASDWLGGRESAEHAAPLGRIVPVRDRRRASPLSRALADVYAEACERAGLDPGRVASVFGSALGEATTMIGLLDQMWGDGTPLSPMKFATSVHNAAAGTVSIATGNRGFTTSLGADYDTPAMGLLEGIAFVIRHGEPVVVCCGDEAPPDHLVPGGQGWSLFAAAIALRPAAQARAGETLIDELAPGAATLVAASTPASLGRNPNVGLLDLIVALERGRPGRVRLDRGAGRGYCARIAVARSA